MNQNIFNLLSNTNNFSLTKILQGISKSLTLLEEIKPIYNNIKPIFNYISPRYPNNDLIEVKPKEIKVKNETKTNSITFFN